MGRTVVMFPGQGAQIKGMGEDFYNQSEQSRNCFEKAQSVTGIDLKSLIFEENENLNKTEYTQIALYVTETAMLAEAVKNNFTYDCAIGLSLGEYSALTACGGIDFEDGARLVRKRGIYMENAVPAGNGTMAAVLGLAGERVEDVIAGCGFDNVCVANYNCPGQVVISGEKQNVLKVMDKLKAAGAKRVIELNVSGPFHSPMLKAAGEQLFEDLKDIKINNLKLPYFANYTAEAVGTDTKADEIRELLAKQVYSSVKFEQSIRKIIADGYDTFVEIGPGKTLTGFVKKTAKEMERENIRLINIEKISDIEKLSDI